MAINFSEMVYSHAQNVFGRQVLFTPKANPTAAFSGRGILDTDPIDVQAEDGSIISETRVVLDIRDDEFAVMPVQGDRVDIPADPSGIPARGPFEIIDADPNGGGETTLTLRHIVPAKP
jgi:hypothetical protein